ncbi:MAG: TspO/MBR family protein [Alphaproteobacteria bacterium]|nr:TspO/MBR family protein [Alphaproteobacteria bacterium]
MSISAIPSRGRDVLGFLGFLAVVILVAAAGRAINAEAIPGWYATLERPPITPPNWVFGPVWTALYLMMTVAAWQVWRRVGLHHPAIRLYWVQLALNLGWTALFFGLQSPLLAGLEIVLLVLAIGLTIRQFHAIHTAAAWLMVPYLAWTSFALVLSWWFWVLQ